MTNQRVCILVALCAMLSSGIVIRGDRSDSDYIVDESEFPATFVYPEPPANKPNRWECAATLYDSHHALTAAHCVGGLKTPFNVKIDKIRYKVDAIYKNPCFSVRKDGPDQADIAILHIEEAVHVPGIPIYGECNELGQEFTLVGWGDTGRIGIDAPKPNKPDENNKLPLRSGTNIFTNHKGNLIQYVMDSPSNGALDREAIAWSGDSGGPAMIKVDNSFYIVGVNSAGDCCKYGQKDGYARVSSDISYNWITTSIANGAAAPISNCKIWKTKTGTPTCTARGPPGPTPAPPPPGPTPAPTPPPAASCANRCGKRSGECPCDPMCVFRNDCCSDYDAFCCEDKKSEKRCKKIKNKGRCERRVGKKKCQKTCNHCGNRRERRQLLNFMDMGA